MTALYDYQPGVNDGGAMVAWLAVQQEGVLNLAQHEGALAEGHLLRYSQTCLNCLLSDRCSRICLNLDLFCFWKQNL